MNKDNNELSKKEKIEKIIEIFIAKEKGQTVSLEEINEITQEDLTDKYAEQRFRNIMQKVKDLLIEKGFVIRSVYGVGYYILKSKQISSYTYRNYIVKPMKQFDKAKKILENTNKKELKDKDWSEYKTTVALNDAVLFNTKNLINSDEYKDLKPKIKKGN